MLVTIMFDFTLSSKFALCLSKIFSLSVYDKCWEKINRLVVRASNFGSGDPGSILGRVGVLFP